MTEQERETLTSLLRQAVERWLVDTKHGLQKLPIGLQLESLASYLCGQIEALLSRIRGVPTEEELLGEHAAAVRKSLRWYEIGSQRVQARKRGNVDFETPPEGEDEPPE